MSRNPIRNNGIGIISRGIVRDNELNMGVRLLPIAFQRLNNEGRVVVIASNGGDQRIPGSVLQGGIVSSMST